ncbi:MAG: hypothetical protein ACRCSK_04240 [Fusobacteriaceae bacterium]
MKKKLTDEEIDIRIQKSLKKLPFEMKRVKVYLFILRYINSIKKIFGR